MEEIIGDGTVTHYRLGPAAMPGRGTHRLLDPPHAVCNAHLLRNLQEMVKLEQAPDGWAAHMQRQLLEGRGIAIHGCETTGAQCRPPPAGTRPPGARAWSRS